MNKKPIKGLNQILQAPVTKRWRNLNQINRMRSYYHQGLPTKDMTTKNTNN